MSEHDRYLTDADTLLNAAAARDVLPRLVTYSLDPTHPRGRHKAYVFAEVLEYDLDNAEELAAVIAAGIKVGPAPPGPVDHRGVQFRVEWTCWTPADAEPSSAPTGSMTPARRCPASRPRSFAEEVLVRKPQRLDVVTLAVPRPEHGFEGNEIGVIVREPDGSVPSYGVEFVAENGEDIVELSLAADGFEVWVAGDARIPQEAGA